VDFGLITPGGGSTSVNTAALSSLFTAMANAAGLGGGMSWIPQYNYPVVATTPGGLNAPVGAIFQGLGTGGKGAPSAFHFTISDTPIGGPYTFISTTGNHTSGGTMFRNIAFQWSAPNHAADACLNFNYFNNTAVECTFCDCPTAIYFGGAGGSGSALACSAVRCSVNYGNSGGSPPANVTAFVVSGIETLIEGPSELNFGLYDTTTTGITIGGGVKNTVHNTIRNVHFGACNYGIDFQDLNSLITNTGGSQNTLIEGCHFECITTCVNISPTNSAGQLYNVTLRDSIIQKAQGSTTAGPIVFVDANGGSLSNVGPILLVNNVIYSNVTTSQGGMAKNGQYGVEIGNAIYVSILGGQISQCGNAANLGADGSANVCISGNPSRVTIEGVNLSATFAGANSGNGTGTTGSAASEFGVLISGNPGNVSITDCYDIPGLSITGSPIQVFVDNCTGLSAANVTVTGTPTTVSITNCIGYNTSNTPINTVAHITTGTYLAANQGSNSGTNYYGPSFVFYTANAAGGTLKINGGAALSLAANQTGFFYLATAYDFFQFSAAPASIQWIGK
jgi:hypothetical protein